METQGTQKGWKRTTCCLATFARSLGGRRSRPPSRSRAAAHPLNTQELTLRPTRRSFLHNDFARVTNKYTKSNLAFKANHVVLSRNHTLQRRREDVFAMARAMEEENLAREGRRRETHAQRKKRSEVLGGKVEKRAPGGSVPLTDYCGSGESRLFRRWTLDGN